MRKELLRILALMLALLLVLGAAAGCGKKKETSDDDTEVTDDLDEVVDEDDDYYDDEDFDDEEIDDEEVDDEVDDEDVEDEDVDDEKTDEKEDTKDDKTSTTTTTKTTTTRTTTTTATSKTTTSKTTTNTASKPEKVDLKGYTIKIACWWNLDPKTAGNVYYQKAVDREKEVRAKYNVKFQFVNVPGQGIRDRLPASVLAGDPLGDIVRCRSGWVLPTMAGKGYVEPADKYFDVSDPLWNPYIIQQSMYNGRPMGVNHPAQTSYYRLFYNRTLLQRLGLADPQSLVASKQWTWAKFEEYVQKIAEDTDNDGKLDRFGVANFPWQSVIASNGGKAVSDVNGKDVFTLNSPESVAGLKWYQKLHTMNVLGGASADFVAGKAGFHVDYGTGFKANMKDKWGVLPMPLGPNAKDYACWWDEVHLMCIPANSKHPKETAAIWTDLSRWYPGVPGRERMHKDILENMYDDQRDVEMDIFLSTKFWLDKYFAYPDVQREIWPGGGQDIENVLNNTAGKTVEQWLSERSAKCQNSIDQLWASFKK